LASRKLLAVTVCLVLTGATNLQADPEFDYLLHCGGCHLEDGSGDPPMIPDLRENLDYLSSIPAGRAYIAQVPGSSHAPLSDPALAEVLNWMLERFYPAEQLQRYQPAEIASYRGIILMDPLKVRATLIDPP
jgi:cytochrome c peroxidase